jgi:D-alanine-D-alanine ligase
VAVLSGGDSEEREISRQSGAAVQAALTARGHLVVPMDPAVVDLASMDWRPFDAAFIALHGRFGEDGQVQQLLETADVPYTGCDAATSRLAFSKSAAKERFAQFGVPTPPSVLLHYGDDDAHIQRQIELIGYPLVVKPDAQGSSLGITIVSEPRGLRTALRLAFEYDSFVLIEQAILGTEWTVGLIDDQRLPALMIRTPRMFFDYQAKYHDEATEYLFQPGWPAAEVARIEDAAARAAEVIGTRGVVRVDLRVDEQRQPWVLEINTVPGFTSHSLIPKMAAQRGWDFGQLCERALASCLEQRAPRPHIFANPTVRQFVA